MANRNSEAYDFELFEPKPRVKETPKKSNVIEIPREKLQKNRQTRIGLGRIIPAVLSLVMLAGILGAFIFGQAQLTELTTSIDKAQKTLQEEQGIYKQLKIKSDSRFSLKTVETYASQKLGMDKTSQSQVTTVQLSKGDKAQVVQSEESGSWLERFLQTVEIYLS